MDPMMMQQQGGMPQAPQAPQQGGPMQSPQQALGFIQGVQDILYARVQALTEDEINTLDTIITPETYPILVKIFPELEQLFEQGSNYDAENSPADAYGSDEQGEDSQGKHPLFNNVSAGLMGG